MAIQINGTSGISGVDGSAGTPALQGTDSNTGISFGTDTVNINTGGTTRATVDSSGRVGIGTSSPSSFYFNNLVVGSGSGDNGATIYSGTASAGVLAFADGTSGTDRYDGYINYDHSNQSMGFFTNTGNRRMTINSSGNVGIGTSPSQLLHLSSTGFPAIRVTDADNSTYFDITNSDGDIILKADEGNAQASSAIRFNIDSGEKARIDSSGRLLVGTSSARASAYVSTARLAALFERAGGYNGITIVGNENGSGGSYISLLKSRGTTTGSNTLVANGDNLGGISFEGTDGTAPCQAASILTYVDGTPGANDMPGRIVFSTTADGASSSTERMRISSSGELFFNTTTVNPGFGNTATGIYFGATNYIHISRSDQTPFLVNRNTSDGTLVDFRQDGTQEGTISVSGTTVSYNGAHLSRWSQLPSGVERTEILRGSVLSNIDEMCEWGDEENEQLNRMKVSDVEGDKNVSGVFQAWDDDDDTYTNDFYCAMTGDFIIRIAAGTTVERGDLLMSAGDGTAKPQDDDIIRSKTIAKVTSTNVSCTYDDGSYCVPCVLMAC